MIFCSDMFGQSTLITDLDYSSQWLSSGIYDNPLQIRDFSSSSTDYSDLLPNSTDIASPSSSTLSSVATEPGSVFSTAYNIDNTRTVLGTLDANSFTFQSGFSRTVISGNGNVDFGSGWRDLLDLSGIYSNTVTFSNASNGGGVLYNIGNGTRLFDSITLSDGSQILFEGIDIEPHP